MLNFEFLNRPVEEPRLSIYKRIIRGMWIALGVGVLSGILLFIGLSFTDLPDTEELENPKNKWASLVLASNGEVLGRYFTENRVPVDFEDLSPYVVQALLATEDERYYKHCGIDFQALGRVFFKTLLLGQKSSGGASTVTQQLAKLLFTGRKASGFKRVVQKLKEWIIAVQLERKYTKEEIIAMYLNKFDFLYDSHGIQAAAETYFGKSQDSLTIEEAATLVGMLKNPSLFNPRLRPDTVKHRREVVLKQMLRNKHITQEEYDSLRQLPLDISRFSRKTHHEGIAQYFRMVLSQRLPEILASDFAKKKANGEPYDIYRDGLKIYTTIDPTLQRHAEAAMWKHMQQVQKRFWKIWSWQRTDPWNYRDEETTPTELKARQRKLNWLIQQSDRYQTMRSRYLDDLLSELAAEVEGLNTRDIDIERMLAEEKRKGHLKRLVSNNLITEKMALQYRKALKSEVWPRVKSSWEALQEEVKLVFNKPVPMKVFAYNEQGEKDTIMSPLDSIKYHHGFLQIGSLAVDPRTGHIKAWIGGINHKYFAFDHVNTSRQVGSTFKPFVYATAIAQQGFSPCYLVQDLPRTIFPGEGSFGLLEPWTPSNANGQYSGQTMTLKYALRKSVNTVSVFLMQQLGSTEPVRELVRNMGIDVDQRYPNGQLRVPKAPSICLGSCDLSVFEMTGAYTTFANNGYYSKPIFITRIEDSNGRVIYREESVERQALQEIPNYVMVEMLKYASGGMGLKSEAGGKTGTTNDFVDGWFMGITPTLVVGTWVGGEDRWIRFLDLENGQGSRMAKPFFVEFIKRLEEDESSGYDYNARFHRPSGPIPIQLDCQEYEQSADTNLPPLDMLDEDEFIEDPFGDEIRFSPSDTIRKKKPLANDIHNRGGG